MQVFPESDVVVEDLVPVFPGPSCVLKTLTYWSSVVTHSPASAAATAKVATRDRIIWYLILHVVF